MKKIIIIICILACCSITYSTNAQKNIVLWSIGKADHSASEFALAPNGFKNFVGKDFGASNECCFFIQRFTVVADIE